MRKKYPQCRPRSGQNFYDYHNIGVNHCGEYECRRCGLVLVYGRPASLSYNCYITPEQLKESLKVIYAHGDWQIEWARMKILKQYIKSNWGKFPEGIYSYGDILGPDRQNFIDLNNDKEKL